MSSFKHVLETAFNLEEREAILIIAPTQHIQHHIMRILQPMIFKNPIYVAQLGHITTNNINLTNQRTIRIVTPNPTHIKGWLFKAEYNGQALVDRYHKALIKRSNEEET